MAFASPKCYAPITTVDVVLGSLDRRMRNKPSPLPMRMWLGDFLPPRLWVLPLCLPNPPGPVAPLTIGVQRRVHKRIRKRCNYRVIPRKDLKFRRLLSPFFFPVPPRLFSCPPLISAGGHPNFSQPFSLMRWWERSGGREGGGEAVKLKSEENNKLE